MNVINMIKDSEHQISNKVFVMGALIVLCINIVFHLTYPINIGAYDYPNYLRMIADGSSNLVHASGYPAVLCYLLNVFSITPQLDILNDRDWISAIQSVQFYLHIILFSTSIWVCNKVFNRTVAFFAMLGWGCNILFMSAVDTAGPEWLQGHTIILSLLLSAYATSLLGYKKIVSNSLSALLMGVSYLVKFNAIVFLPILMIFILFDKTTWRTKIFQVMVSILFFGILVFSYASTYHYRTTGTKNLTFDHAWVLITALREDYFLKEPEKLGIHSLRWLTLNLTTPPEYERAHAYTHVDYGAPPEVKIIYKQKLDNVLHLSKNELIELVKKNSLPMDFKNINSATPLYYYYGLKTTDQLGSKVFFESLLNEPWQYTQRVFIRLANGFVNIPSTTIVPTFVNPLGVTFTEPNFQTGEIKIKPPVGIFSPYFSAYYNPREIGSLWGIKFFGTIDSLTSSSILYLMGNFILIFGVYKATIQYANKNTLILGVGLLIFMSASTLLFSIRYKEIVSITPLYFVLLAIGLAHTCHSLNFALKKRMLQNEKK